MSARVRPDGGRTRRSAATGASGRAGRGDPHRWWRLGAVALLPLIVGAHPHQAAANPAVPAPVRVQFDRDPFSISGSGAEASGSVSWSRGAAPREINGRVAGRLRYSGSSGCARIVVSWMNATSSTISSDRQDVCAGESDGFNFGFSSAALECVRVQLEVRGVSVGPTRLMCAGGS